MNKSSLLGYLAKLYASIASLTDNKFYGFKNGELAEIVSSGGTPLTRDTFVDYMIAKGMPVFEPFRSIDDVGWAVKPLALADWTAGTYSLIRSTVGATNNNTLATGTAAAVTFANNLYGHVLVDFATGTTATGEATIAFAYDAGGVTPPYRDVFNAGNATFDLYMVAQYYLAAASSAAQTYIMTLNFGAYGTWGGGAPAVSQRGVMLTYTDAVNSGRWVITYIKTDLSVVTLNTTVAPSTAGYRTVSVRIKKTGATSVTITVVIEGVTYTITDSILYNATYVKPAYRFNMRKTVGTTSSTSKITGLAMYCSYPL